MKKVRQLVERQSAQEGPKKVDDEYTVSAERAEFLEGRGFVEIVGDVPDPAPAVATTAKPAAKKKSARKGRG